MTGVLADERLHEFTGGQPASHAELRARYERWAAGPPDPSQTWLNWIIRQRTDGQPVGMVQATLVTEVPATGPATTGPATTGPATTGPATPESAAARPGTTAYVAWVVGSPWQRQGFAAEAAAALVAWLRGEGVAEIVAHIHPEHRASAAVATRAGLRPTAELADGEQVWRLPRPGA
jgi:RimJ/RimL family protein N-acetyltransferase